MRLDINKNASIPVVDKSSQQQDFEQEIRDGLLQIVKAAGAGQGAARAVAQSLLARIEPQLARINVALERLDSSDRRGLSLSEMPALPDDVQVPLSFFPEFGEANFEEAWQRQHRPLFLRVAPWLADYIDFSVRVSPESSFDMHLAGGLWVLSTVAARRVYADLAQPVHTPLFLLYVARSSLFAKTRVVRAATNALEAAGLDYLRAADESTPAALLSAMAGREPPANYSHLDPERQEKLRYRLAFAGQRGWFYDEFGHLLDAIRRPGPMADFAGLLKRLDDGQDIYEYHTRSHGEEAITKPYLTLLAATTPANLAQHAGAGDAFWSDGFWPRFAVICPPRSAIRTRTMTRGREAVPAQISSALVAWHKRLGIPDCRVVEQRIERTPLPEQALSLSDDTYAAYDRYREALRSLIIDFEDTCTDFDAAYARLPDRALRIATLFASLGGQRQITLPCWQLGQAIAERFRLNLHEFYRQVNGSAMISREQETEDAILALLARENRPLTARELQRCGHPVIRRLKADSIRERLQSLERAGAVQQVREGRKESWNLL